MLKTYLIYFLRSVQREKTYYSINIVGLSIGIACCLILGLYLHSELNYDKHNLRHEQIVRVGTEAIIGGNANLSALTSSELAPLMARDFVQVEEYVRFADASSDRYLLRSEDTAFYWEDVYIADANVFDVFTHDVIYGDPETALIDPSSIAISESLAAAYFGDENPLGRTLESNSTDFRISLVFADQPQNTHLRYDALLSFNLRPKYDDSTILQLLWNMNAYSYLVLSENYQQDRFSEISELFYENHMATIGAVLEERGQDISWEFFIEPLTDIHMSSTTSNDQPHGNLLNVYGYIVIVVFVLLVACFNYINLATARATRKAREIGIRKVIGAGRKQLTLQFLAESIFFTLLSLGLAFVLAERMLSYPTLTNLLDVQLSMAILFRPEVLGSLISAAILLGAVTGSYPAMYLSSMSPASALKNKSRGAWRKLGMRQVLVFLQFTISICVIASTLLLTQQMTFISSKALGFEKDNKLLLKIQGADQVERLPELINELQQNPGIISATSSREIFGERLNTRGLTLEDNSGAQIGHALNRMNVQPGFIAATGLELVAGRDFDDSRPNGALGSVIVNEALMNFMGWENALGKVVQFNALDTEPKQVIGVVRDFHYEGLQNQVMPVVMDANRLGNATPANSDAYSEWLILDVAEESVASTIALLQQRWSNFDPTHPFEVTFLEDRLNALYGSEEKQISLIALFSTLCIFISCMGLYGLASFTTAIRTKEIGVRKILGASTTRIILMLFKNVAVLIIAASALASAMSFWAVGEWLQGFSYRIDLLGLNLFTYAIATAIAAAVAFTTTALQSFSTAQANPVKALRYE